MTIDQLNKEIAAEINALQEGELGEVILDDEFFGNAPEPDAFLEPAPDVIIDIPDDADDDWWEGYRHQHPFLLGMYIPMKNPGPGQVILFGNNLKWFFKSLLKSMYHRVPYLTKQDIHAAWALVQMKTHSHEMFHYYCDVLHCLFGGGYTYIIEEALAVAWARQTIQGQRNNRNTQMGRMNGLFYNLLMNRAFAYRSPGYKDWVLYADDIRFKPELVKYLSPGDFKKLQGNGVDVEHLVYSMLGQCSGGFVQRIL